MSEERRYSKPIPGHPTESFEARIDHWMGDLNEFQSKLGMHDPGNGFDPYFPKLSGVMTSNSKLDAMIAFDMKRYPEKWAEPALALPSTSRRQDVVGAAIRLWFKARRVWAIGTDRESVKKIARIRVAKAWNASEQWINDVLMVKLGAPKPKKNNIRPK